MNSVSLEWEATCEEMRHSQSQVRALATRLVKPGVDVDRRKVGRW
jgi:hypothetical protein